MNSIPWSYVSSAVQWRFTLRSAAAAALRQASGLLEALARELAAHELPAEPEPAAPVLEFHAEAGAPEGALYVNGRLVGRLEGVNRL
jgi:hypothetical protein